MSKNRQKIMRSIYLKEEEYSLVVGYQEGIGAKNFSDAVHYLIHRAFENVDHISEYREHFIELKEEVKELKKDREITLKLIRKQMELMENLEKKYSNHKEDLMYEIEKLSRENQILREETKPIKLHLMLEEMKEKR